MRNLQQAKTLYDEFNDLDDILKDDIEYKILTGVFAVGERIPTTRKIAEDYDIGLSTAQKVLNILCEEGVIESKRGVGYFVKPYTKEQIQTERRKKLEKDIMNAVEEADLIEVNLLSMGERIYAHKKK